MSSMTPRSPLRVGLVMLVSAIALIGVGYAYRTIVLGVALKDSQVLGLTQAEVAARFGEPDEAVPQGQTGDVDWVYYHGLVGRASAVGFEKGTATTLYVRSSR